MTLKELKKAYQKNLKKLLKALKEGRTEDHLMYCKIEKQLDIKINNKYRKGELSAEANNIPNPVENLE